MKKQAVKNQVGSSRTDTVLKMLLIAFISLLAFSSGVYFGKKLSDSDYQLKALESDFNKGGEQASNEEGGADEAKSEAKEEGAKEEDVAALAEKAVASEKGELAEKGESKAEGKAEAKSEAKAEKSEKAEPKAEAKSEAKEEGEHHAVAAKTEHAAPKHVAAAAGRPDLSAATKAAQRVASNASPIENAPAAAPKASTAENRAPSSLPKTVGASQDVEFTVQVASYPTAEAAKDHAAELVKKGFPAFPVEATVGGKTWYRVSVGSFKTQKEAVVYRAQLLKQTTVASAIVQKIQR